MIVLALAATLCTPTPEPTLTYNQIMFAMGVQAYAGKRYDHASELLTGCGLQADPTWEADRRILLSRLGKPTAVSTPPRLTFYSGPGANVGFTFNACECPNRVKGGLAEHFYAGHTLRFKTDLEGYVTHWSCYTCDSKHPKVKFRDGSTMSASIVALDTPHWHRLQERKR